MPTSTPDPSSRFAELISGATLNSTPSPESEAGHSPCASPAGQKTEKSGPAPAPASLSRRRAKAKASKTSDIFGPSSYGSSPSGDLQRSLESKLLPLLAGRGAPEYDLTLKRWDIGSLPSIFALRASARRTSDKDFIGWPTPCTQDGPNGGPAQGADRLPGAAALAGWSTPLSTDHQRGRMTDEAMERERNRPGASAGLSLDARLAGWPTTTRDCKSDGRDQPNRAGGPSLSGMIFALFRVPTGRRVVLAPEFSLWLMGFPEAWVTAAPGAKDWQEAQALLGEECSKALATP